MTLDHAAALTREQLEHLIKLEKALKTAEAEQAANGIQGHSIVANYDFMSKLMDAAPQLLALAREALAARRFFRADERMLMLSERRETATAGNYRAWLMADCEYTEARSEYAALVSAHTTGGAK